MKIENGCLSPQQLEFFETEGYFIAENVFDPKDLDALRAELDEEIDKAVRERAASGQIGDAHEDKDFDTRLAHIYRDNPEAVGAILKRLTGKGSGGYTGREMFNAMTHPKLLRVVESIVGEEIVASSVYRIRPKIPGNPAGEVPWHQDSGYFSAHCDRTLILTCWMPLVNATVENGCMYILPRSHRTGILRHYMGGPANFLIIQEEDLPTSEVQPVAAECPKGGVVFMTNLTAHCSRTNYTGSIRWSLDLRYQNAEAPNNLGLWPTDEDAEDLQIACYPPEADFVVQSRKDPAAAATYETYRERRLAFERATAIPSPMRKRWTMLASTSEG